MVDHRLGLPSEIVAAHFLAAWLITAAMILPASILARIHALLATVPVAARTIAALAIPVIARIAVTALLIIPLTVWGAALMLWLSVRLALRLL